MRTECDYLVLGSGVAGLSFALEAARHSRVTMVTKRSRTDSATNWAQGGIIYDTDSGSGLLSTDIMEASDGTANPAAIDQLVREGPAAVRRIDGSADLPSVTADALQFVEQVRSHRE